MTSCLLVVALVWWRLAAIDDGEFWVIAVVCGSIVLAVAALVATVAKLAGWHNRAVLIGAVAVVASIASYPVETVWEDECNGHVGIVPAGIVPYVQLAEPTRPRLVYSEVSSLLGCP